MASHPSSDPHQQSLENLDRMWAELDALLIDEDLIAEAAALAASCALRGYDAGDPRLLRAWSKRGMETFDVNQ